MKRTPGPSYHDFPTSVVLSRETCLWGFTRSSRIQLPRFPHKQMRYASVFQIKPRVLGGLGITVVCPKLRRCVYAHKPYKPLQTSSYVL